MVHQLYDSLKHYLTIFTNVIDNKTKPAEINNDQFPCENPTCYEEIKILGGYQRTYRLRI